MNDLSTQPIQPNQRMLIVDILRGWALFGVVLMNYYDFFLLGKNFETFKPDTLTSVLMYVSKTFFAAKSWTLLSLIFGYGFAVLMNNINNKGHNPYGFFAGRMFWLLVFALINSAIFYGDILKDYAILGLLLLFFYRSSAKTTFIISIILLLSIPALHSYVNTLSNPGPKQFGSLFYLYKSNNLADVLWFGLKGTYFAQIINKPYLYTVHVVMFCCFLWGFTLYKCNFFADFKSKRKYIVKAFWITLGITLLLTAFFLIIKELKWTINKYYNMQFWLILSTMVLIGSTICWLYIAGKCKRFFAGLAVIGKMTLTNYIMQNLIGMFIFSGFGLSIWNTKPIWFYFVLATAIYALQVYFSSWWLSHYNYGPVEWVWRQLSYRKHLPLKNNSQTTSL